MPIDILISQTQKQIDHSIAEFFSVWRYPIGKSYPELLTFLEVFQRSVDGGKRLRGVFLKLGYGLVREDESEEILKAAVAIEIFQAAILIHDDVIDRSELRRGKNSVFMELGGGHLGKSQAICLGDLGFFLAFDILAQLHIPAERKSAVTAFFSGIARDTVLGQMLDVFHTNGKGITEELLIKVFIEKTAKYSTIAPLVLGGIMAGGKEKLIDQLGELGKYLGIAYQIKDDLLGVTGDKLKTGKPDDSDIREGKKTLPLLFAYKSANKNQLELLNKYYGNKEASEKDINNIRQIFRETGAIEKTNKKMFFYSRKAVETIRRLKGNSYSIKMLEDMIDYLLHRNR